MNSESDNGYFLIGINLSIWHPDSTNQCNQRNGFHASMMRYPSLATRQKNIRSTAQHLYVHLSCEDLLFHYIIAKQDDDQQNI